MNKLYTAQDLEEKFLNNLKKLYNNKNLSLWLGSLLKIERLKVGKSLKQVAKDLSLTKTQVYNFETGRTHSLGNAIDFAFYYGKYDYIFETINKLKQGEINERNKTEPKI